MINLKSIDYKKIITKLQVKKPWDIVIISILNILIAIPLFIILHQNLINLEWTFHLDRILLAIVVLALIHIVLYLLRTILILCVFVYLIVLFYGTIIGNYGFFEVADDYNSMLYSMMDDPNPQDIIISHLLPFPNKSKITEAVEYRNPKIRNFAIMATSKYFRDSQKHNKYRILVQCFAVFKEINSRWNYVNDPKSGEYIAKASESVRFLSGDCDDHSIFMSACVKSIGGVPRIISTDGHLYPEILIGSKADFEAVNLLIKQKLFPKETHNKNLHYHIDERGQVWLNLDYTAKYPGGPFMHEIILGALTLY